jgi:hypothetical protein
MGQTMVLISLETGLFCRLARYPDPTASASGGSLRDRKQTVQLVWGMLADQPTAATATAFTYTRTGLMYQGEPLVAQAMFYPLLWSNTTTLPGTSNTTVTVLPQGEPLHPQTAVVPRMIATHVGQLARLSLVHCARNAICHPTLQWSTSGHQKLHGPQAQLQTCPTRHGKLGHHDKPCTTLTPVTPAFLTAPNPPPPSPSPPPPFPPPPPLSIAPNTSTTFTSPVGTLAVVDGVLTTMGTPPPAPPGSPPTTTSPATTFTVTNVANPSAPVTENVPVLLRSNATGQYCGTVVVGGSTQMVCNITDPQLATPVTIINGQIYFSSAALMPTVVGQPAVFVNSTTPGAGSPPGASTTSGGFTAVLPAREFVVLPASVLMTPLSTDTTQHSTQHSSSEALAHDAWC